MTHRLPKLGSCCSRRPSRDEQIGDERLDELIVLIEGLNAHTDESPVGARLERPDFQHFGDDVQPVSRPDGSRPSHFIEPRSDQPPDHL